MTPDVKQVWIRNGRRYHAWWIKATGEPVVSPRCGQGDYPHRQHHRRETVPHLACLKCLKMSGAKPEKYGVAAASKSSYGLKTPSDQLGYILPIRNATPPAAMAM